TGSVLGVDIRYQLLFDKREELVRLAKRTLVVINISPHKGRRLVSLTVAAGVWNAYDDCSGNKARVGKGIHRIGGMLVLRGTIQHVHHRIFLRDVLLIM